MTAGIATDPVLVDSSGWLEYITDDVKAPLFAPYFEGIRPILVPAIVIYEVRKVLLRSHGKAQADQFISHALRRQTIPLDEDLAIASAEISLRHKLAMADAIVYATALQYHAEFVTSDQAFQALPNVTLL